MDSLVFQNISLKEQVKQLQAKLKEQQTKVNSAPKEDPREKKILENKISDLEFEIENADTQTCDRLTKLVQSLQTFNNNKLVAVKPAPQEKLWTTLEQLIANAIQQIQDTRFYSKRMKKQVKELQIKLERERAKPPPNNEDEIQRLVMEVMKKQQKDKLTRNIKQENSGGDVPHKERSPKKRKGRPAKAKVTSSKASVPPRIEGIVPPKVKVEPKTEPKENPFFGGGKIRATPPITRKRERADDEYYELY